MSVGNTKTLIMINEPTIAEENQYPISLEASVVEKLIATSHTLGI